MKGTYSTAGDKIMMKPSHHSGLDFGFGFMIWMDSSDPLWYNKNEFKTEWIASNDGTTSGEQIAIIGNIVNDLFASSTSSYSVSGNTLAITSWDFNVNTGEKQTFTRKK